MTVSKTISVTFSRGIDKQELVTFLGEVPQGVPITFSVYKSTDQRDSDSVTLRAVLPLTAPPNMHPDAGGPR